MVPSAAIALRFRASRAPTGRKARATAWGYACVMHGYEPALAPALPALYDARKALAWLGAKLAATLLVGEPLSPEELYLPYISPHLDHISPASPYISPTSPQASPSPPRSARMLPASPRSRRRPRSPPRASSRPPRCRAASARWPSCRLGLE